MACAVMTRAFTPTAVGFRAQVEVLPAHLSLQAFPGRWHVALFGKHLAPACESMVAGRSLRHRGNRSSPA